MNTNEQPKTTAQSVHPKYKESIQLYCRDGNGRWGWSNIPFAKMMTPGGYVGTELWKHWNASEENKKKLRQYIRKDGNLWRIR